MAGNDIFKQDIERDIWAGGVSQQPLIYALGSGSRAAASQLLKSCRGSVLGKSSVSPIRRHGGGGELVGGMFPTLSLPAGAALGGFPLPEGGEEARADTPVGTRGAGGGICAPGKTPTAWNRLTTPWGWHGGCVHHVDPVMSAGTGPGGRSCLAGCQVLLSLCVPFPVSPTSASPSSAIQPSPISSLPSQSDPSTAFSLCPACYVPCLPIQFPPGIELTCCLLPPSRSSIKMLSKIRPKAAPV